MTARAPWCCSLRERWHVAMVEAYGWISGRCLVRTAQHALAVNDGVTIWRVREVVRRGYEVGWSEEASDDGRCVPNRAWPSENPDSHDSPEASS